MNDWISVKDQLPDVNKHPEWYDEKVLVLAAGKCYTDTYFVEPLYYARTKILGVNLYRWVDTDLRPGNYNAEVKYWMPMPQLSPELRDKIDG